MSDNEDLEAKYSDDPQYSVQLNNKQYALTEKARRMIQERAEHEYSQNPQFSCWWRVATAEDEDDPDTVHQEGDPILVIETQGVMVPWEKLDQLEVEMQDTSSFSEFDAGGSDSGGGMRTVDPNDVDSGSDDSEEKERTHFEVTPQDFEEVPSPDGESPEKVPAKPDEFDEPSMVVWVPDNPDITHTWGAGEAITSVSSWVEWNVQQKANQPRLSEEKPDSHDHWESIMGIHDCPVVGEMKPSQQPSESDTSDSSDSDDEDVPDHFKEGKFGGGNWQV